MDDGQHGDGAIDIGEDDAGPGQRYGHRKAHGEQAEKAEKQDGGTNESRAMNREAAGTVALAIVAAERELRESQDEKKTFTLVGKEKNNGP